MNAQHQNKINEIAELFCASIKVEAQRLLLSGGIDEDDFSPDEFVLAKILITSAIRRRQDDFIPLKKEHIDLINNLCEM